VPSEGELNTPQTITSDEQEGEVIEAHDGGTAEEGPKEEFQKNQRQSMGLRKPVKGGESVGPQ